MIIEQVFNEIFDKSLLQWPKPVKGHMSEKGRTRYCKFHRDYGHDNDHCFELMEQIESLIDRGYLGEYVSHYKGKRVYGDTKREFSLRVTDFKVPPIPRLRKYPRSEEKIMLPRDKPEDDREGGKACEIIAWTADRNLFSG